jgi:hypothetical protein
MLDIGDLNYMVSTKMTQTAFLHDYLRGTGRTLTEKQAKSWFGIGNLRARLSELRQAGLRVRKESTKSGQTKYSVSRRDVFGLEFSLVNRSAR